MRIRKNNKPSTPVEHLANAVEKGNIGGSQFDDIVEVSELPKQGWHGTTVPNSGYVEKFYFNTNLNVEEVENIIKNLEFKDFDGLGLYFVLLPTETDRNLAVMKSGGSLAIGVFTISDDIPYVWVKTDDESSGIKNGWQIPGNAALELGANVIDYFQDLDISVGTQNDKLSSLISTTPFVKEELPKDVGEKIYKVKDTVEGVELKCTAVPHEGLVEKIYFNINLNKEEVLELIKDLPYAQLRGGVNSYIVFADTFDLTLSSGNFVIVNNEIGTGDYQILASLGGTLVYIYSTDSDGGWYNETELLLDGVEYNSNSIMSSVSSQLGLTMVNEKLSKLFSITPFEEVSALIPTGTYSYYVYNGKEFVKLDNIKDNKGGYIIELPPDSGTITPTQWDTIINNDNVIIKIGASIDSTTLYTYFTKEFVFVDSTNKVVRFISKASLFGSTTILLTVDGNALTWTIKETETIHDVDLSYYMDDSSKPKMRLAVQQVDAHYTYLEMDTEPVQDSYNVITSGAVYNAIGDINALLDELNGEEV